MKLEDEPRSGVPRFHLVLLATGTAFLAGALVTALSPVPANLPAIAMGSTALFHIERTLVAVLALISLLTLIVRGSNREIPLQLTASGVHYEQPPSGPALEGERAFRHLAERLATIESVQSELRIAVVELRNNLRESRNS